MGVAVARPPGELPLFVAGAGACGDPDGRLDRVPEAGDGAGEDEPAGAAVGRGAVVVVGAAGATGIVTTGGETSRDGGGVSCTGGGTAVVGTGTVVGGGGTVGATVTVGVGGSGAGSEGTLTVTVGTGTSIA